MKTCCKCKTEKQLTEFYANTRTKDGVNLFCKECHKAHGREVKRLKRLDPAFRAAEAVKKAAYRAKNRDAHKEYMRQWHENNAESQTQYRAKYREENSEYFKEYAKINAGKLNAKTRKRQAAKIQRTPQWLDVVDMFEMECIYMYAASLRNVGLKYDVDHIYPLQGKLVSGLHVPSNLRVIHESENRSKNNKFEVM